jgi:phosphoribosylformylglycinamidine cyclo-ligase
VGVVALDRVVTGAHVQPGDVVVGLASSGIHANGLSLARRALLEVAGLGVGDVLPECGGHTVADELLTPTRIYVRPVLDLLNDSAVEVRALAHVTGDGLLNVARVDAPCGFVLDNLPPPPPVFDAVARRGGVPPEEMHLAFNMGVGFCVTVPPAQAHVVVETAARHGVAAWPLGRAVRDPDRTVHLPSRRLVGHPVARRFVPG